MKKIALIVAIAYLAVTAFASLLSGDSLTWFLITLATHTPVAAVLFLLVWGIGSLVRRK
jgi:hypothetical protein